MAISIASLTLYNKLNHLLIINRIKALCSMFIIALLHKRYTFNICIRFNDIIFYIHFVIQICIGYKRYDILLNHMERSTRPHDTIPRTVGRISSQTTGKSNFFGRKDITRDYLCILQVKTKHTMIKTTGLININTANNCCKFAQALHGI